jgi:hypothetical protein
MYPKWRKHYYCGFDIGQLRDHSALVILEKVAVQLPVFAGNTLRPAVRTEYHCQHLERLPLHLSYPDQVDYVARVLEHPVFRIHRRVLVVDGTGVGTAIIDLLRQSRLSCTTVPVTITGGDTLTRDGLAFRVPKKDLVANAQVLLQNGTVKLARNLPESHALIQELLAFQMKTDARTGHDSYDAKSGSHDDLVLALSLAVWFGEKGGQPARLVPVEGL